MASTQTRDYSRFLANRETYKDTRMDIRNKITGAVVLSVNGDNLREVNLNGANLRDADLRGANLYEVDLSEANLYGANLYEANLSIANLSGADLSGANISEANLSGADLREANLREANLRDANLRDADLREANLSMANLSWANLSWANLSMANLSMANLSLANLSGANISQTLGLTNSANWISESFSTDAFGVLVYKRIGKTQFSIPSNWVIAPGAVLSEIVNPNRTTLCGCGVNFGTLDWCQDNYKTAAIWICRIAWIDLADVVVPYNTDGKARCARLQLLEEIKIDGNGIAISPNRQEVMQEPT